MAERKKVGRGLTNGETFGAIGGKIGKDKGAISREVNRADMDRFAYRAHKAQARPRAEKRQGRKRKSGTSRRLERCVLAKLKLRWSPERIAKEPGKDYPGDMNMRISGPTIYAHVYVLPGGSLKKELLSCLRQQRKYRRKKGRNKPESDGLRG